MNASSASTSSNRYPVVLEAADLVRRRTSDQLPHERKFCPSQGMRGLQ